MKTPMIAPSILAADFLNLSAEIQKVSTADWLHVDVMDGHFVPNLTIGLPVVKQIAQLSLLPVDCHLMITDPEIWAPKYAACGVENVTFHLESTDKNVFDIANSIRANGARAGISIKPETSVIDKIELLLAFDTILIMSVTPGFGGQSFQSEVLEKVKILKEQIEIQKKKIILEIDGGIDFENIQLAAQAGIDCFVAGTTIYNSVDPKAAIALLRENAFLSNE